MSIDNTDDIIDSRDVIARIEELEEEREGIADDIEAEAANARTLDDWDAETLMRAVEEVSDRVERGRFAARPLRARVRARYRVAMV